jgi:NNP family nitrate/nitrite transporter-like MFS transporter
VRKDIGICDNDDLVQLDIENTKCECKKGGDCKATIADANVCAVSFDILTRFLLGSVIERFGPKNTDCMILLWGMVVVGCSALVTNGPGLITVRFFVSALGSTFVVNQFWNSIMFNKKVVGTANATAGGWGNLGGGLTQVMMPLMYKVWHDGFGLSLSQSWRLAMLFPAVVYAILAVWIFFVLKTCQAHLRRLTLPRWARPSELAPQRTVNASETTACF